MPKAPALGHGEFTCSGDGLKMDSYPRASTIELRIQTGLSPVLTPKGRISKKQRIQKQPLSWWIAQLHFYGLDHTKPSLPKSKRLFKKALEAGLSVPKSLLVLEERLNKEYELENEKYQRKIVEDHEKYWDTLTTNAQRARHDLGRFLREIVVGNKDVHVLRGFHDGEVERVGKPLGLICQCVEQASTYSNPYTVVGTSREDVAKEVKKLERQVIEEKFELRKEEEDKLQGHESTIEAKRLEFVKTGDGGNVGGNWILSFPELSKWHDKGDSSMELAYPDNSGALWGKFDLHDFEGIIAANWSRPGSGGSQWRGQERKFVWRGRETGEGQIQHDDDENQGTITFTSPSECVGFWKSAYGAWSFKGWKVSNETTATLPKLKEEFSEYTADAHRYEEIHRW
jgi:hypothetical protein